MIFMEQFVVGFYCLHIKHDEEPCFKSKFSAIMHMILFFVLVIYFEHLLYIHEPENLGWLIKYYSH